MRHFLSGVIVFGIFIAAYGAWAGTFDAMIGDIEMLEDEVDVNMQIAEDTEKERLREASDEIFPDEENIKEKTEPNERQPFDSDTHVSLRVNGIPVVLSDVPLNEWFAPYVRDVANRGIISGYRDSSGRPIGDFGPSDNVTIEQLAKVSLEAAGIDEMQCGDIPSINKSSEGSWAKEYIACAEANDFVVYSDGTVDVKSDATRTQVVVTVLQAFSVSPVKERSGKVFLDVPLSLEFGSYIETAERDNIVSGYTDEQGDPTGIFGPFDTVNRAEIAKIISLASQVYGEEL
jgi:hypothetical protein